MTDFGSYITNEYGILKLIFSHLSSLDLLVVSSVCREWREVARRVQLENNCLQIYNKGKNGEWEAFNGKIHPKVILHFLNSKVFNFRKKGLVVPTTDAYRCPVFSVKNTWYITSKMTEEKVEVYNERDDDGQSVFLIPDMFGVNVKLFFPSDTENYKKHCETVSGSKCCVVIGVATQSNIKKIHKFIMSTDNPRGLVLAGGLTHRMLRFGRIKGDLHVMEKCDILGIAFDGENVEAHSDIHKDWVGLEKFMKNFAERVGPKPEEAERIAFMFVCVNRHNWYDDEETTVFSKYFPQVPVYGIWSLGEFSVRNPVSPGDDTEKQTTSSSEGSDPESSPLDHFKVFYEECTSFLVITFKKKKQS